MGLHRKWTTATLCHSARSAIQLFYIHYRRYLAIILNSAVYLSSARVNMVHTLVPLLLGIFSYLMFRKKRYLYFCIRIICIKVIIFKYNTSKLRGRAKKNRCSSFGAPEVQGSRLWSYFTILAHRI